MKLLLSLLLLLSVSYLFAQTNDLKFQSFNTKDGLSDDYCESIIQDSEGYMWIAAFDGLNRYNGYRFETYRANQGDIHAISNNNGYNLFMDSKQRVWCGVHFGHPFYYDKEKGYFEQIILQSDIYNRTFTVRSTVEDKYGNIYFGTDVGLWKYNFEQDTAILLPMRYDISCITFDGNETLLIGSETLHSGLICYNTTTHTVSVFRHNDADNESISGDKVKSITQINDSIFWVGTYQNGLNEFNYNTKKFRRIEPKSFKLPNNFKTINKIFKETENILWVGSTNDGLFQYNIEKDSWKWYMPNSTDRYSLPAPTISNICSDVQGNIWVSTHGGGIAMINKKINRFALYDYNSGLENSIITSFLEDKHGNFYLGTDGGYGLQYFNIHTKEISKIPMSKPLSATAVVDLEYGPDSLIYIATWAGGVNIFNPKNNTVEHLLDRIENPKDFQVPNIKSVHFEHDTLYIGTNGDGLYLYPLKSKKLITAITNTDSSLAHIFFKTMVFVCIKDSHKNLWVAGSRGIFQITDSSVISHYSLVNKHNTPSDNYITHMLEDSKQRLWIGTKKGINLFDYKKNAFIRINEKINLYTAISAIMEVDNKIWFTTNKGITIFDPEDYSYEIISGQDGLQGDQFTQRAVYKAKNGNILAGGLHGFNIIDPEVVKKSNYTPPIYLTELRLFNIPQLPGEENSILQKGINLTKALTLNHHQSFITLDFVAIDYATPEKIKYAYKLDGFNNKWFYIDSKRSVSFTNLPAGEYSFLLKATNSDGVWSAPVKRLQIKVLPPWWETWWFRSISISVLIFLVFSATYWRIHSIQKQKYILEKTVNERTLELKVVNKSLIFQKEKISNQNALLTSQKDKLMHYANEIKNQNKKIISQHEKLKQNSYQLTESIQYAKRIQQSILPSKEYIKELFPESFVLYKPKDIVSGDFYWATQIAQKKIISVVDCTGHGIPGAFMSMIGSTLLNEIIVDKKILHPLHVLEYMNTYINDHINTGTLSIGETDDGMDMTICSIDYENKTIRIATAIHKFIIISDNIQKIYGGGFYSVGGSISNEYTPEYNYFEFPLQSNTSIYMFSDGFKDQFGGYRSKKMGINRFTKLMHRANEGSMEDAYNTIKEELDQWKGITEQVDDILVVGIRI